MTVISVFVINLARSVDRLAHIDGQLRAQSIVFERMEAVDGNRATEAEYEGFIAARPRPGDLVWRRGQMGCFLSHFNIWRKMAHNAIELALVLEDDVRISSDLADYVYNPDWFPEGADIVRIETTGQWLKLADSAPVRGSRKIARVQTTAWATGGYVISGAAAQKLLATDPRTHMPVDAFLFDLERSVVARELNTMQLVPAMVTQDKFDSAEGTGNLFGSEIEGENPVKYSKLTALRRAVTSRLNGKTEITFR